MRQEYKAELQQLVAKALAKVEEIKHNPEGLTNESKIINCTRIINTSQTEKEIQKNRMSKLNKT